MGYTGLRSLVTIESETNLDCLLFLFVLNSAVVEFLVVMLLFL